MVDMWYERDFAAVERELRLAARSEPNASDEILYALLAQLPRTFFARRISTSKPP
jgi:hypothetical protein